MIVSSVSELIDVVGNGRLAAACDVHHATPWHWRKKGLPTQPKRRAQHYRRVLADLAGISTSELSRLESGEVIVVDAKHIDSHSADTPTPRSAATAGR